EMLALQKTGLETRLKDLEEDNLRIKALDGWTKASVNWLDEFYDLADLWPDTDQIRLTQLNAEPITRAVKDTHVAKLLLKGIALADPQPINTLMDQVEM